MFSRGAPAAAAAAAAPAGALSSTATTAPTRQQLYSLCFDLAVEVARRFSGVLKPECADEFEAHITLANDFLQQQVKQGLDIPQLFGNREDLLHAGESGWLLLPVDGLDSDPDELTLEHPCIALALYDKHGDILCACVLHIGTHAAFVSDRVGCTVVPPPALCLTPVHPLRWDRILQSAMSSWSSQSSHLQSVWKRMDDLWHHMLQEEIFHSGDDTEEDDEAGEQIKKKKKKATQVDAAAAAASAAAAAAAAPTPSEQLLLPSHSTYALHQQLLHSSVLHQFVVVRPDGSPAVEVPVNSTFTVAQADRSTYNIFATEFAVLHKVSRSPPAVPLDASASAYHVLGRKGCHVQLVSCTSVAGVSATIDTLFERMSLKQEALLVVGSTVGGLTDYLIQDVFHMCQVIGMPADLAEAKLTSLSEQAAQVSSLLELTIETKTARLRVVWNPTWAELQTALAALLCDTYGNEVVFAYCGHGDADGTMELHDFRLHGSQLRSLLDSLRLQHFPFISFLFNCCFALDVCCAIVPEQARKFRRSYRHTLPADAGKPLRRLMDTQERERRFMQGVLYQKQKVGPNRSLSPFEWSGNTLYLIPFSDSPLPGAGALVTVFQLQTLSHATVTALLQRVAPRFYVTQADCKNKLPLLEEDAPMPADRFPPNGTIRLRVFQAGNGDSSLLQYGQRSMLIDGGMPPVSCFWQHVRHLTQIDLLALTHADGDHVHGLLTFMHRKVFLPQEGPNVDLALMQADWNNFGEKRLTRHWQDANALAEVCRTYFNVRDGRQKDAASPRLLTAARLGESRQVGPFTLLCVLPTKEDILLAQEKLQAATEYVERKAELLAAQQCKLSAAKLKALEYKVRALEKTLEADSRRDLSAINVTGIVLIAFVQHGDRARRSFLFTGDADGEAIVRALACLPDPYRAGQFMLSHTFDVVDMPHHGSKKNHPKEFLFGAKKSKRWGPACSGILARNLVVSTSGAGHHHPDGLTLRQLNKYLDQDKTAQLYFNYQETSMGRDAAKEELVCDLKSDFAWEASVVDRINFPAQGQSFVDVDIQ